MVGGSCSITSSSAPMSSSIARSSFGRLDPGGLRGSWRANHVPRRPTSLSQVGGDFNASTSLLVKPTWRPPIHTVGLRGLSEEYKSSEEEEVEDEEERGRMWNSMRLSIAVAL